MSGRLSALVAAAAACVIVLAQLVFPGQALFHTWQYALALGVLAWMLVSAASRERRGWLTVAMLGAMIVVACGLASGLLGPDTETIAHAPGTIAPLPDVGAAAFFSSADAQAIESGGAPVIIRRRNHRDINVPPGSRRFLGALLLIADPRPAAYVEATDSSGNHLTVTQPTGSSFLSPVLLFGDRQEIAGASHPVDGFSLPAESRTVKAVYFTPSDFAKLNVPIPPAAAGKPAILYDVFDAKTNRSVGIGVAPSGELTAIGGVRLRSTIGRYPRLVVASAPQPLALLFGLFLFVAGGVLALLQSHDRAVQTEAESHEEKHGNREHRVRARSQES
ncbi:MAG: hypothetical protein JO349_03040 [Candidatus Eremiobacteraeota bacterium]|nr:hypothetical protein [Candidatus Eremiobacteraeota bacterium]MBV8583437.1 hypothetical protein [Candidatus Eremiobacteraeota bacterium]